MKPMSEIESRDFYQKVNGPRKRDGHHRFHVLDHYKKFELQARAYEEQLRQLLGATKKEYKHFKKPKEKPFTISQREHTTILYGGLTLAHEYILKGAMLGLGYKVEYLPCPDNEALAIGKEYCSRGECNPTYYTVGNLIKYLLNLRDSGMSVEEIEKHYVFFTAGSCGPCRFGMYEAEYRKALSEAGFRNFRVLLFQQSGGLNQANEESGIQMDSKFFVTILKAIIVGDLLNDIGYKIRPYEVNKGEIDKVMLQVWEIMFRVFQNHTSIFKALCHVRKLLSQIKVDYTKVKPRVKIIGEFWAQTTEGDGNYRLARWLEEEGAEVIVEPVSTWIEYLIWSSQQGARDRIKVQQGKRWLTFKLAIAKVLFEFVYDLYRAALGFKPDPLPSMKSLAKYAHPYYNTRLRGGEGHLEVGKTIMATLHKKAHLVISVKPFGCMPSTQSDGVQAKVVSDYKDCIFIPIETSGDSEVNVKSRVQMKLYEAKQRALEEFQGVLDQYKLTAYQFKKIVEKFPALSSCMQRLPHRVVSTSGNFACYVGRSRLSAGK